MKGKVIVTSGATREPIDSVRFISNFSSGRTGAAICEALAARGFQVIQVAGVESTPATGVARRETFTDHASLDNALRRLVRDTDCVAVVHTAAVSDFAVVGAQTDTKIPSGSELSVKLQPTHKIIERIMGYAGNPNPLVTFGEVKIDKADRRAWLGDKPVDLTRREWAIMDLLTQRASAVISKEQIEEALYAFGSEIESNTVEVHISRLRKKLGRDAIQTLRGVGYRLGPT